MKFDAPSKLTVALAALTIAQGALAAVPVELEGKPISVLKTQFSQGLQVPGGQKQLQTVKTSHDFNGVTHTRLAQYYEGVPVYGSYAITHTKNAKGLGKAVGKAKGFMTGRLYKGLAADLAEKPSATQGKQIINKIVKPYDSKYVHDKKAQLIIYLDKSNQAHWAYKTSFLVKDGQSIPKKPTAIVDAKTHNIFASWDDIKTERMPAKGMGFGGNERVGQYQFGGKFPLLDISRDENSAQCYMENTDVRVVDMEHRYGSNNRPMSFSCHTTVDNSNEVYLTGKQGDGYDMINGANSPSNDALYAGYVIKHMYRDWYDLPVLVNDNGSPMQLLMRVHYGSHYENAFWDGMEMTYGDGGDMMYPLVSLGVGAHEVSHGFTEQNSGLEYYGHSGGMNEAFSDMAAQAAEYYSEGSNSWMIGERIMKLKSGYEALRYMDKPSKDGRSIDTADEYYEGLDVHHSSGVYNHLFYLLSNQPGWNTRKAFDVMVKANRDYWTPYASFSSGACGVLQATADYAQTDKNYDIEAVKKSLDGVHINYQQCSLQ